MSSTVIRIACYREVPRLSDMRSFVLSSVFVVYTMMAVLAPFKSNAKVTGYKYCLFECANCVVLWGDDLYDGEKCAKCCLYSNGVKLDTECKVWNKNRITYDKKDEEYVNRVLGLKKRYSTNLDYKSIYAEDGMPDYCFSGNGNPGH